jgi:hypothetical protein
MSNIIINPRCEADRKKCTAFMRIYISKSPEYNVEIERDYVKIENTAYYSLLDEVECRVLEYFQGDYRVSLKMSDFHTDFNKEYKKDLLKWSNKEYDFWYRANSPFYQHDNLLFVLRFEAPQNFQSSCL